LRASALPAWLLGALTLASVLALLAPLSWPFELFAHFRVQYAAAALLLAAWLGWQRRARPVVVALALAGWHAMPAAQALVADTPARRCDGPAVTVATVNVHYTNPQHEALLRWLQTEPADVVVLQEVTSDWVEALAGLAGYPHRRMLPREDPYGIGVLSRQPLGSMSLVDLAGDGLPSLVGEVEIDGRPVRILGLHTRWPVLPGLARLRDEALGGAAALAHATDLPVIVLGDLNVTPDSPAFDRLLQDGGLHDALAGRDWQPTWMAGFWPLALRIDHVLVSSGTCVEQAELGPAVGSDHVPVLARLRLP
jgi:endonuclease/exonuclease/phosphatase (EEP) superfamily protein YafD